MSSSKTPWLELFILAAIIFGIVAVAFFTPWYFTLEEIARILTQATTPGGYYE